MLHHLCDRIVILNSSSLTLISFLCALGICCLLSSSMPVNVFAFLPVWHAKEVDPSTASFTCIIYCLSMWLSSILSAWHAYLFLLFLFLFFK